MFDTVRNFEKMHRAPDEAFFGLGVANNLLVAFYHEFLPIYVGQSTETLALAYSPKMAPITIKNSRGKGFTAIIKRITLEHGGVELNNQLFRTHYNSHIKDMSDLTEKEKCILDKGMNHSRITADKHYCILQQTSSLNGNSILDRQLMNGNQTSNNSDAEFISKVFDNMKRQCTRAETEILESYFSYLMSKRNTTN